MTLSYMLSGQFDEDMRSIISLLTQILQGELKMASNLDPIAQEITQLTAAVTAETTVNQSAITLLGGLSQQLAAAIAAAQAVNPAADLSALQALQTTIDSNTSALSSAITANTPATPPAPAA
jgi:hypothetical protein